MSSFESSSGIEQVRGNILCYFLGFADTIAQGTESSITSTASSIGSNSISMSSR